MKPQRIPKIIHYCWFGQNEKPEIVKACLKTWDTHLDDYELIEWNESNFDLSINTFVKEAYEQKKYAFVSDYVRVYALFHYGGIYLDTDVEVYKPFDDLLHHDSFWGFEQEHFIATSTIGAVKHHPLIKQFLDGYENKSFVNDDGTFEALTNVAIVTDMLVKHGLIKNGKHQELAGIGTFYPQTYFSPYDYINCRTLITDHTYTLHHFYKSWLPPMTRVKGQLKKMMAKIIGGENIYKLRKRLKRL